MLQFHKGRGCGVIIVRQFQPESVGFVFIVTAKCHQDGQADNEKNQAEENPQGQGGEVR